MSIEGGTLQRILQAEAAEQETVTARLQEQLAQFREIARQERVQRFRQAGKLRASLWRLDHLGLQEESHADNSTMTEIKKELSYVYDIDGTGHSKNQKELLSFLNKLSSLTKNVKNLQVNDKSELITFDDGHTEEIFRDGSKIITTKNSGKTIVIVSHSLDSVSKLCDRAVWIYDGEVRLDGNTKDVVNEYLKVCG